MDIMQETKGRKPSLYRGRQLRVGLFVDEINIFRSCKYRYGYGPDYRKLRNLAVDENLLFRAIVYTVELNNPDKDDWVHWLPNLGFDVRSKPIRRTGAVDKANWDVDICMDVVRMLDSIDIVVLASGDGDFVPLIRYCQGRGKIVRVISVHGSTASEMREIPDEHIVMSKEDLFIPDDVEDRELSVEEVQVSGHGERVSLRGSSENL